MICILYTFTAQLHRVHSESIRTVHWVMEVQDVALLEKGGVEHLYGIPASCPDVLARSIINPFQLAEVGSSCRSHSLWDKAGRAQSIVERVHATVSC